MDWLTTTWEASGIAVLSAAGVYAAVILHTRIAGLRSFSKMSAFDFAMTIGVGSMIASTILWRDVSLLMGVVGIASLFGLQYLVSWLRVAWPRFGRSLDNRPVLIMRDGRMLEEAMRANEITRSDVLAKLREANVLRLEDARAVVLETTGDISVLHAPAEREVRLDIVLEGVQGA
jgi:uncharacterized membrane protein YcaP (DUF421 family)